MLAGGEPWKPRLQRLAEARQLAPFEKLVLEVLVGCHVSPSVQRTFLATKPGTGMDEMTAMSPITVRPAPVLTACCQDICLSTNGHIPGHQWACSCSSMGMFLSADGHIPAHYWACSRLPMGQIPVQPRRACTLAWLPYSAGSNLPRMQSVTDPGLEPGTMTRNWCQTSQHIMVVLKV